MKILIINGPNINLLGLREPELYGRTTYEEMIALLQRERGGKHELSFFQSNSEGALVDAIQQAYADGTEGIVINPAAYTHTSIAIADALRAVQIPFVEVHLSDPDTREAYRGISYVREDALATVKGRGVAGYSEAIDLLVKSKENA